MYVHQLDRRLDDATVHAIIGEAVQVDRWMVHSHIPFQHTQYDPSLLTYPPYAIIGEAVQVDGWIDRWFTVTYSCTLSPHPF